MVDDGGCGRVEVGGWTGMDGDGSNRHTQDSSNTILTRRYLGDVAFLANEQISRT